MTNEIVKQDQTQTPPAKPRDNALAFIEQIKSGWNKALPKVCTPERFARVALTCLKKDSKLMDAIQYAGGRASVAAAFMKCAELGIEPDGRRAYLIPYKNNKTKDYTVELIIDYKGIVELAMRSGYVANIHADKVCENDEFEYNIGTIEKHRIDFKKPRGDAYAYYAIVTFKDGTKKCEVMNKDEIDAVKKRSSAWDAWERWKKPCPWNTDYDEMAKKTVFKRLSKWIPQSPEMRQAIDYDDEDYKQFTPEITMPEEDLSAYDAIDLDQKTPEEDQEGTQVDTNDEGAPV
jgi:recombination protein RecT